MPDPRQFGEDRAGGVLTPAADLSLAVFAARPEIPPADSTARPVAATRFRLARAGGLGKLRPAVVQPPPVPPSQDQPRVAILSLTRTDDIPFEVCEPGASRPAPYPSSGLAPLAGRPAAPWLDDDLAALRTARTLWPPLVDVVSWRCPGELTRSTWQVDRLEYARGDDVSRTAAYTSRVAAYGSQATADASEVATDAYEPASLARGPAVSVTLRRPRAAAGRFEAVRLDVTDPPRLLLEGAFLYARMVLTQTVAATEAPGLGAIVAVMAGKSDIFPSAVAIADAVPQPALLTERSGAIEPFGTTLVAEEHFIARELASAASRRPAYPSGHAPKRNGHARETRAAFDDAVRLVQTVVIVQKGVTIPSPRPSQEPPPTLELETGGAPRVMLVPDLPNPLDADPFDADPSQGGPWTKLFGSTYDFNIPMGPDRRAKINAIFDGMPANEPVVLLVLRYSRSRPIDPFQPPESPLAAIVLERIIDGERALVKPKMGAAILQAPAGTPKEDDDPYRLAGFGRLDDDDFSPIRPAPGPDARVDWSRTAVLQTVDRVAPEELADPGVFRYDVVFYGPGGELIPTRSSPVPEAR